jgi:hypothetical protein
MVPGFLYNLISSFLETNTARIVASVTVRFSGVAQGHALRVGEMFLGNASALDQTPSLAAISGTQAHPDAELGFTIKNILR